MRLRAFCFALLSFVLSLLIVFSAGSIDAFAAPTGGHYLTINEARAIFGESISFTYYDGSDYVTSTASYDGDDTIDSVTSSDTYTSVYAGAPCLIYRSASPITTNTSNSYITVSVSPRYSISNTDFIHTFIGAGTRDTVSSIYQSPSWDWSVGHFENSDTDGSGHKAYFTINSLNDFTFVPVDYSSGSSFSAYCLDADFQGNYSGYRYFYYFAIGIPYVSGDASAQSGTLPASSGGIGSGTGIGDINVNVDVDMEETNGLLGDIIDVLDGLVDHVAALFITDENYIEEWKISLMYVLNDSFAPYEDTKELLDDFAQDLFTYGATTSIQFPSFTVPGTNFTVSSRAVNLRPQGFESTFAAIRTLINIIATCAVANMIMTKVKAVLVGETVAEVGEVDEEL